MCFCLMRHLLSGSLKMKRRVTFEGADVQAEALVSLRRFCVQCIRCAAWREQTCMVKRCKRPGPAHLRLQSYRMLPWQPSCCLNTCRHLGVPGDPC